MIEKVTYGLTRGRWKRSDEGTSLGHGTGNGETDQGTLCTPSRQCSTLQEKPKVAQGSFWAVFPWITGLNSLFSQFKIIVTLSNTGDKHDHGKNKQNNDHFPATQGLQ